MAYATVVDVKGLCPLRSFTASTVPNANEVVGYLTETAAVLDGILAARGYQLPVPIIATVALELLEHYNAIGGWYLVEHAAGSSATKDAAAKAWENAQKMLRDGLIEPVGLARDEQTTRPRAQFAPTAMFTRDLQL